MTDKIIHQSDLVARLGKKLNNLPLEDIRLGVICILSRFTEALCEKQSIAIRGLGRFTCEEKPTRTFYHPKQGVNKTLPARFVARFRAGKMLQSQLQND